MHASFLALWCNVFESCANDSLSGLENPNSETFYNNIIMISIVHFALCTIKKVKNFPRIEAE